MFFIKRLSLSLTSILLAAFLFSGCTDGDDSATIVSTLTRPTSMAIAVLDYSPSESERQVGLSFGLQGLWEECLGEEKRPIAFVANSGNDSVARIDLCTGEITNTQMKGNPFIVSHIKVGKFPIDVAVSKDSGNTRVFVANGGEQSLSIINAQTGRTLPDKVQLSGTPLQLITVPDVNVPEGRVFVALSNEGKLAIVSKKTDLQDQEIWLETGFALLKTELTPEPIPAGMAINPDGSKLYVADMNENYFHIVDLEHPEYPARVRNVYGPTRNVSVSPDGRFLYLSKLDQRRMAVYDLIADKYVDTNSELLSHRNVSEPSEDFVYDIELEAYPRKAVFATVVKERSYEDYPDGDEEMELEIEDGDTDSELEDFEGEAGEDQELSEDAEESEDTESAQEESSKKSFKLTDSVDVEDGEEEDEEDSTETEEDDTPPVTLGYIIGFNGNIQVVDLSYNLHELYDTNPDTSPSLNLVYEDDLQIDNAKCVASIDYQLYSGITPDGHWELLYNGTIPKSDQSLAGHFDMQRDRFYDETMDFSSLKELMPRPNQSEGDDYAMKGDLIVITTPSNAKAQDGTPCTQAMTDDEGNPIMVDAGAKELTFEITDVTPGYLEFDRNGVNLEACYNSHVDYYIRANDNYLVSMTPIDSSGQKIGKAEYQGRAINTPFRNGDVLTDYEQIQSLNFEEEDWDEYMCTIEYELEDGEEVEKYIFKQDMAIADTNEDINGIRCKTSWKDGNDYPVSFSNDLIRFSVCQDEESTLIKEKRNGSFLYTFRTNAGINVIQQVDFEGDRYVGTVLEDAVLLDLYKNFPRLYVVDSSEEIIYVIDLKNDQVVQLVM